MPLISVFREKISRYICNKSFLDQLLSISVSQVLNPLGHAGKFLHNDTSRGDNENKQIHSRVNHIELVKINILFTDWTIFF